MSPSQISITLNGKSYPVDNDEDLRILYLALRNMSTDSDVVARVLIKVGDLVTEIHRIFHSEIPPSGA